MADPRGEFKTGTATRENRAGPSAAGRYGDVAREFEPPYQAASPPKISSTTSLSVMIPT